TSASSFPTVMPIVREGVLSFLLSLFLSSLSSLHAQAETSPALLADSSSLSSHLSKLLLKAAATAFSGALKAQDRLAFTNELIALSGIPAPDLTPPSSSSSS